MKVMYQKSSKSKKIFAMLMCMLMMASMFYANIINSNAEGTTTDDGTFTYTLDSQNNGEATITGFVSGLSGDVTIPDIINNSEKNYSVKSIGEGAFEGCTGLTSVTIPDSVTSIGYNAFNGCTGLKSLTIPDSVTSIGAWAFYYCTGLTSVIIPDSVTSIGDLAFSECTGLTSISVDSNNTTYESIDGVLFSNDAKTLICYPASKSAPNYDIPDSVTSIGVAAFASCTGLTSVTIPGSVTSIGYWAFNACTGLTSVTIPDLVTSIGNSAFNGCTGLKSLTIPDSVTSIGDYAFSGCIGLKSLTIPDSVTSIGNYAFNGCTGLTSVIIPNSVTTIGIGAFGRCTNLSKIYIPEGFDIGVFSSESSGVAPKEQNTKYDITDGQQDGDFIVQIKRTITYKNYDGSDIENLPENYPTTYIEGQAITLPTDSPDSTMSGYEFLGFWDCPLDQSKKVTVPGSGYEDEQSLDLTVGNKITKISDSSTGDITLYARYTSYSSGAFDEDVNGRENYIFGAPGVFPNDSKADMRVLEPGTEEYANTLQHVDDKDIPNIKIVEFRVLNSNGETVQPNTFFGDAVIGFKIPEGFNTDDISLIRVVANGEDITLRSRIWTDPDNSDLKYIEGTTNHFSPYAILSPWNENIAPTDKNIAPTDENIAPTGDNTWIILIGAFTVLAISAGIFILMNRKKI